MRERQSFDPVRFSADVIAALFCNIEAVLELHRQFLRSLQGRIRGDVPKFTTEIGTVFVEFVRRKLDVEDICMTDARSCLLVYREIGSSLCIPSMARITRRLRRCSMN